MKNWMPVRNIQHRVIHQTRRDFLFKAGTGFGALALAHLLARDGGAADAASSLFGFPRPDGQARYLWRLFGVRDVMVGLGTVASTGSRRRVWARVGLACDVADGTAGALGRGAVTPLSAAAMVGVPAAAVAFGAWALR